MKITWLGHSCFQIITKDTVLVMDPYQDGSVPGLSEVRETADLVLCSHGHGDHCGTECVKINETRKTDIKIEKIDTFHDHHRGAHRGANTIYIVEAEGCRIAHLGDLGCCLEEEQKNRLKHLDLLLVPVGGFFTIDAQEAAELVRELQPKTVIPMHYRDEENGYGYEVLGKVEAFTALMEQVVYADTSELCMEERPLEQVVVLKPRNLRPV